MDVTRRPSRAISCRLSWLDLRPAPPHHHNQIDLRGVALSDSFDPVGMLYLAACEEGDEEAIAHYEAIMQAPLEEQQRKLDRPDALHVSARWYASKGVPVFPLQPSSKKPLPGSHGLDDATTDLAKVDEWWSSNPSFNIGAATGHVFDVIDVDGPAGHVAIAGVQNLPPVIAQAITCRPGGRHLFIAPTGSGNRAGMLPSVDYRGLGGYVVLPPSVGPNGKRYSWLYPLDLP